MSFNIILCLTSWLPNNLKILKFIKFKLSNGCGIVWNCIFGVRKNCLSRSPSLLLIYSKIVDYQFLPKKTAIQTTGKAWNLLERFYANVFNQILALLTNPFLATCLLLYPLKTSENQRFFDVFWGHRKRPVSWNGLMDT